MIAGERQGAYQTKSSKDIDQAAALIEWFVNNNPSDYLMRERLLLGQGKGWAKRYQVGLSMLNNRYPQLADELIQARIDWGTNRVEDEFDDDAGWA